MFKTSSDNADVVVVSGYTADGDGGGGVFVKHSGGDCSGTFANGDDGGIVIYDGTACYYRQFTGAVHLKWYGVNGTTDIATQCPPSTAPTNCLTNAFNAAQHIGNNTVDTDGLRIVSTADVVPLAYQRLTCSSSFTGLVSGSNYADVGGAIVLGHGARVFLTHDQVEFDHCIVLTDGSNGGSPIDLDPSDGGITGSPQRTVITNYANMVTNSDTGVLCDTVEQPYIHDVTVVGFDTGIAAFNCSRFRLDGANIDANVAIYSANAGSAGSVSNTRVSPLLATEVNGKNSSYTVKSVGGDSSTPAHCKVTIDNPTSPVLAPQNGDTVYLLPNNPGSYGTISCHGRYTLGNLHDNGDGTTSYTLDNSLYSGGSSSFVTTSASGSWVKNSQVLNFSMTNPTDVLGIRAGETVTSSDSAVFGGMHANVLSVSKYPKAGLYRIVVDRLTLDASPTSPAPSLIFYNNGDYTTETSKLYLYPSARVYAGNSIGGAATGGRAACLQGGGPGDDTAPGLIVTNSFCFGHLLQYHFDGLDPMTCAGCGMDSDPELSDDQQIGLFYGHGLLPLTLTATLGASGGSPALTNFLLNGVAFNPCYAGWAVGDPLTAGSHFTNNPIASIACSGATGTVILANPVVGTGAFAVSNGRTGENPTGKASFIGSVTGGGNVVVDTGQNNSPCNAIADTGISVNMQGRPSLELLDGCIAVTGSASNQANDVLIGAGLTTGSSMVGSFIDGQIYHEDPMAPTIDLAANRVQAGEGNGLRQCNPGYNGGCPQYSLNSAGGFRLLDVTGNPVSEVNDAKFKLGTSYQDGIQGKTSASPLVAGLNVVTSCTGSYKVQLPGSNALLDVSAAPAGSACGSGQNCGAAGGITVVNNNSSAVVTVVPASGDTINSGSSATVSAHTAKTFWPVAGVGWMSN